MLVLVIADLFVDLLDWNLVEVAMFPALVEELADLAAVKVMRRLGLFLCLPSLILLGRCRLSIHPILGRLGSGSTLKRICQSLLMICLRLIGSLIGSSGLMLFGL